MAKLTAEEYAPKWATRTTAAVPDTRAGIAKVAEAPGVKAAKAADRMLQGVTDAVTSGLWARTVGAVSLDAWKASATNKGLARIASGVQAAQADQVEMARKLLAAVDNAVAKVNTLPKGNLDQNIARAVAFMTEMSKAKIK